LDSRENVFVESSEIALEVDRR